MIVYDNALSVKAIFSSRRKYDRYGLINALIIISDPGQIYRALVYRALYA